MSLWTMTGAELAVACAARETVPALRKPSLRRAAFSGYRDFQRALQRARDAATRAYGDQWHLVPGACCRARVPGPWVRCVIAGRASVTPRDLNIPAAEFWPGGALPIGPEYPRPLGVRRLASVRVQSPVSGLWHEMHPYEMPAWMAQQEAMVRRNQRQIAMADAAD